MVGFTLWLPHKQTQGLVVSVPVPVRESLHKATLAVCVHFFCEYVWVMVEVVVVVCVLSYVCGCAYLCPYVEDRDQL